MSCERSFTLTIYRNSAVQKLMLLLLRLRLANGKIFSFVWDTMMLTVCALMEKLHEFNRVAMAILVNWLVTSWEVASLVGKVRFLARVHFHLLAFIVELQYFIAIHSPMGWDTLHPLLHLCRRNSFTG